jgi:hypothetical protein
MTTAERYVYVRRGACIARSAGGEESLWLVSACAPVALLRVGDDFQGTLEESQSSMCSRSSSNDHPKSSPSAPWNRASKALALAFPAAAYVGADDEPELEEPLVANLQEEVGAEVVLKRSELVPAARDPRWAAALGARYHESGTPARAAASLPCAKLGDRVLARSVQALGSKRKSLRTGSPLSPWNESMAWRQPPSPGAENPDSFQTISPAKRQVTYGGFRDRLKQRRNSG